MNDNTEKIISAAGTVALSPAEKAAMRHMLQAHAHSYRPVRSPAALAWSWLSRHALASVFLALLLILAGTTVSAHSSGPNDALYGFRLSVNDRIEAALAFDENSQTDIQAQQIERQLDQEDVARDEALDQQESSSESEGPQSKSEDGQSAEDPDADQAGDAAHIQEDLGTEEADAGGLEM